MGVCVVVIPIVVCGVGDSMGIVVGDWGLIGFFGRSDCSQKFVGI